VFFIEGRRKKEEGRRKKEEGRRKRDKGINVSTRFDLKQLFQYLSVDRCQFNCQNSYLNPIFHSALPNY
jgi:uncharacterized Rmd1/YagE family protein